MKDCAPEAKVASFLPDFARNNNGNLAEQQRLVGPQRGADTTKPPAASAKPAAPPPASPAVGAEVKSEAAAPPPVATGAVRASSHSEFGASGSPPPPEATGSGFDFGSYGRVGIGSDLRGHSGYGVNVVSHGSRLEEPAYLELNFYYGGDRKSVV